MIVLHPGRDFAHSDWLSGDNNNYWKILSTNLAFYEFMIYRNVQKHGGFETKENYNEDNKQHEWK